MGRRSCRDPIVEGCRWVVKNGYNIPFWEAKWWRGLILGEVFSDIYEASLLKGVSVASMGGWLEGKWRWGVFGIPVGLETEREIMEGLVRFRDVLAEFGGAGEGRDEVSWILAEYGIFSVVSCYTFFGRDFVPVGSPNKHDGAYGLVWKADVPFKIKAFGWRFLLDRILTKDCLVYRGINIPVDNLKCCFCGYEVESRNHSFFGCWVVKAIWNEIALWMGKEGEVEEG
ncbi:uncharacterized protein LOC131613241 [Vicia villosa]|uniref:uncharacterized protein LOC131613241 n=1 Tax=Vicia villosa TaxID=3911 RepID=UPI00273C28E1|nr:uncharacterized protein LOC131613241 [Vicia villosa]